jgi:hypothetical protein
MLDERPVIIYGLIDPQTDQIRYIGKTARSEVVRLRQHINTAKAKQRDGKRCNHKENWILSLVASGQEPFVTVLEVVPPDGDWEAVETRWIAETPGLTNDSLGGQGPHGFTWSEETRAKLSATRKTIVGWKHSEETKKKIGDAQRGKPRQPMSEEAKRKISEFQKGKPKPPEQRAKMSAWQIGKELSPETRAKISASLTGKEQSLETRKKHSTTSTKLNWPDSETLLEMKETMSYREIGEELGIAPGTVQTRIHRIRERGW